MHNICSQMVELKFRLFILIHLSFEAPASLLYPYFKRGTTQMSTLALWVSLILLSSEFIQHFQRMKIDDYKMPFIGSNKIKQSS